MSDRAALEAATSHTWPASIELELRRRGAASRLGRCRHCGPLYVQRPFYPEGEEVAHLYLLHPPGGVVSGDALTIRVNCAEGAHALVTTPGATRVYRARDALPQQRQQVQLCLAEAAGLEWFPLETIVYDGACVDLDTDIQLAADCRFIGWEITCFGLPASGSPFTRGSFRQRYRIHREGVPLFVDRLDVNGTSRHALLQGSAALRGSVVTGFFLAGPMIDGTGDALMSSLRAAGDSGSTAVSLVGDFVVGRYLGDSAEGARREFTRFWQWLRPELMHRETCVPRIWYT